MFVDQVSHVLRTQKTLQKNTKMKDVSAEPSAAALIESMRDIGYTFETALADIVDNSITAKATVVHIHVETNPTTVAIAVVDNGEGMSGEQLIAAMRPGSQNPLAERDDCDLGRFGLGLKTASFSQCRRLTVVTRQGGNLAAACWDLDRVAERNEWIIRVLDDSEAASCIFFDRLSDQGTLVLWENLDRLVDQTAQTSVRDHLYERLEVAEQHLALVFHRFLAGERPFNRVRISIRGRDLEPFDPFHSKHPATSQLREETVLVEGFPVIVQPYILPHHKKVSARDWDRYGGEAGYLKNQGFYLYRAGRLIIHATWFRLARQTELTKLARIRIDMPNSLDHLWKIDVKKAHAQPPLVVRERLKKIIDRITGASNRVYTARGRRVTDPTVTALWDRRIEHNEVRYEINREHPNIANLASSLDPDRQTELFHVFQAIERSFPLDALYSDVAGHPESLNTKPFPEDTLRELLAITLGALRKQQLADEVVVEMLNKTEPYRANWDRAEPILSELLAGE